MLYMPVLSLILDVDDRQSVMSLYRNQKLSCGDYKSIFPKKKKDL